MAVELKEEFNGKVIAYYRVSTKDQTIENQRMELSKTYAIDEEYYDEGVSGSVRGCERPGFKAMVAYLRKGDKLVTVDIDRLGRDSIDVQQNLKMLKDKGVDVIIERLGVNLASDAGELLVTIMSKIAEMERRKIMERAQAGRERAKAEGIKFGRKATTTPEAVKKLRAEGLSISKTAERLGVSATTVKRMQKA